MQFPIPCALLLHGILATIYIFVNWVFTTKIDKAWHWSFNSIFIWKFPFEASVLIWHFKRKYQYSNESFKVKFGNFSTSFWWVGHKKGCWGLILKNWSDWNLKIWLKFPFEVGILIWNFKVIKEVQSGSLNTILKLWISKITLHIFWLWCI